MAEVMVKDLGPNPFKVGTFVRDRILHANPISRWMGKEENEKVRTVLETLYHNNVFFRTGWFMRMLSTDSFNEGDADNFGLYMLRGVNIGKVALNDNTFMVKSCDRKAIQDMGKCFFHIPDLAHKNGSFIILEDVITQSFRHMSSIWNPDGTMEDTKPSTKEEFWRLIQKKVYENLKEFIEVMILNYTARLNGYPYEMLKDTAFSELLTGFNYYSAIMDRQIPTINVDDDTKIYRFARPMMYQLAEYEAWTVSKDMFTTNQGKHDRLMYMLKYLDEHENNDPAILLAKLAQILKYRKNGEEK